MIYMEAIMLVGIPVFFMMTPTSFAATIVLVPFTSQAPFGNWAQPWQDFCEEASVVMAAHFLWSAPLTPKLADAEMQIIKQYETLAFKKHKDTSADQTAAILMHLFGFKNIRTRLVTASSDIKEELSQSNIIIAPAAGRLLKNPYFTPPGPLYHMIVITGYDDERGVFIANDPGTRRGKSFVYQQDLLFDAIHDWNNGDVLNGEKKIIVVGR